MKKLKIIKLKKGVKMKKYESMIVNAFTSVDGSDEAHGNPALVVFEDPNLESTEKEKFLISTESRADLNDEKTQLPIISFITPTDEKNEYKIKYRFCNGCNVNVCGHGTVAAAKAVIEKYYKNNVDGRIKIIFYLDQSFVENRAFPTLEIETDGVEFVIKFNDAKMWKVDPNSEIANLIKDNFPNVKKDSIHNNELKDYIFVCDNAEELRNTVVSKAILDKMRETVEYRGIMAVAKSDKEGYDYETTVLSDGLPPPTYKDPACGSANKGILQLIKATNLFPERFQTGEVEKFKMWYPFRYNETSVMGGIQTVDYYYKKGEIYVAGGAESYAKINILINGDSEIKFES